uniref:Raptor N-terminal CASPase-like domain-containing protein n=1 Tax=Schistocephalus solidus TaxID=70667 RepID=A0A0X3NXV4_SCHSO
MDCVLEHSFEDTCSVCDHKATFIANHLNEIIEGVELYKEPYTREKIKTLTVALVICLNVDIDPPDVQKIPPFSRVEAWFDPTDASSYRALETIGKNLQAQYERWQPRARCKQCLDPTLDDVKKLCTSLRRNAKDDRILFHYNGHGVPRPTENGEIWVFNKTFTKYIPLSLYDLQRWLGGPSVYVLDCQNAGRVIKLYDIFCQRRKAEMLSAHEVDAQRGGSEGPQPNSDGSFGQGNKNGVTTPMRPTFATNSMPSALPVVSMENTIMLAACREFEDLPQHPDLPADLFTACLTTPIRTALKWHWLQYKEHFPGYIDEALLDRIPGSHSNRMSLLGEINWIFTAVTDTIAWCSFSGEIFQKLFRQDLLVASLFRNFLLAERIMRMYGSHPCSWPALKPTHDHSMWSAWDHSLDRLFQFLPQALRVLEPNPHVELSLPIIVTDSLQQNSTADTPSHLQELTAANSVRLKRLLSQVLKMRKQTSSAALRADQEAAPPGYGGRATHHEKLLHNHHHRSQGWRPVASGPSTTDSAGHSLQGFSGSHCAITANVPPKRTDDRLTKSAHYDCPHATPLATNSHSARPKFVIEPSSAHEESEAGETGDDRRGPTEKALSRISEEPSNVEVTNTTTLDAANARAPTESRPRSCPPDRRSLLQTGAQVALLRNAQKKESDSKGASEESEVSSNDLEDDDDEYEEEDEDDEDEEEGEEYSGTRDATEPTNETGPPAPTQEAPSGAVAAPHPQKQPELQKLMAQQHQLANVPQSVPPQPVKPAAILNHEPVGEGRKETSRGTQVLPPTVAGGGPLDQTSDTAVRSQAFERVACGISNRQNAPGNQLQQLGAQAFAPTERVRLNPSAPTFYSGLYAAGGSSTSSSSALGSVATTTADTTAGKPPFKPPDAMALVHPSDPPPGADFRPASFFTSQMTAFKAWLSVASGQRQTATQLPILLQVLLSQGHRIRALQLLSEFLDLGPWAVSHCLTVGILPYIVRLFHSNVPEVKPHLVFIWGKIIASAHTDFGRNEAVRESGYKYFTACLRDSANLSPLVRTLAAFALAKMLEAPSGAPDAFFQEVYYKQNFIPLVIEELQAPVPSAAEACRSDRVHLRLWLILALARLWYHNDEARWCGVRHGVHEVLYTYLRDVSPEVRAATVFALGTFVNNWSANRRDDVQALELSQQVGAQLIRVSAGDASPLVRRELVAALCGLVIQYEGQLIATAHQRWSCLPIMSAVDQNPAVVTRQTSIAVGSPSATASLLRGVAELGISKLSRSLSRSQNLVLEAKPQTPSSTPSAPAAPINAAPPLQKACNFLKGSPPPPPCTNIYAQLWSALLLLVRDPCPSVSDLAGIVLMYILEKLVKTHCLDTVISLADGTVRIDASTDPCEDGEDYCTGSPPSDKTCPNVIGSPPQSAAADAASSSTLIHSAQFPGRRTRQPDLVLLQEGPASESQRRTRGGGLENVKTEFFAWASRWFTQPLLQKYPSALTIGPIVSPEKATEVTTTNSSQLQPTTPKSVSSISSLASTATRNKTHQRRQHHPFTPPCLASLSSVSGDPQAVAFSSRVNRFVNCMASRQLGRARWHAIATRRDVKAAVTPSPTTTTPTGAQPTSLGSVAALDYNHLCRSSSPDLSGSNAGPPRCFLPRNGPSASCSDQIISRVQETAPETGALPNSLQLLQVFNSPANQCPLLARFHPYRPHLVVADAAGVSVWGIRRAERVQRLVGDGGGAGWFRGGSGADVSLEDLLAYELRSGRRLAPGEPVSIVKSRQTGSRLTSLEIINSNEERSLVLTASEDGRIRVWKNYDGKKDLAPELVTAW